MAKRLLLAALACLVGLGLTIVPAHAAGDPYPASVATHCDPGGVKVIKHGATFVTRVHIRANGNTAPKGTVKLTYQRIGGGYVSSRSADYPGKPINVRGPVLTQVGRYKITMAFTPTDKSRFRPCSGSYTIEVNNGVLPDNGNGNGNGPGDGPGILPDADGLLPQTGGPNVGWLVLGLALLLAGAGLVAEDRRRGRAQR